MEANIWEWLGFIIAATVGYIALAYSLNLVYEGLKAKSTAKGIAIIIMTAIYSSTLTWLIMAGHTPL